jgi:hypothetical protein
MLDEFLQHLPEVVRPGDQEVVGAFATQGADEAFGDGVGPGCPDRGAEDGDVGAGEDGVEGGRKPRRRPLARLPEPAGRVQGVAQRNVDPERCNGSLGLFGTYLALNAGRGGQGPRSAACGGR